MGLFDKKYCDICSEKIGLLGNRKLADGNMCSQCLKLASPYLTGRKQFAVSDMKDHVAYREQNKQVLAAFNATSSYGPTTKVYIDETQGLWLVTASRNYKNENPDVIATSQVTGCRLDIRETRTEMKQKMQDGGEKSYTPPRYDIDYDFFITIDVNSPWFSEIEFKVNGSRIETRGSAEYRSAEAQANAIEQALTRVHGQIRSQATKAAKPKTSVVCPNCRAATIPDANGTCEYCGGVIG